MFSLGFVILILKVLKQANCSEAALFQKHKGKHLANYVISTYERTKSEVECGTYCLGHGMCASVNYKTSGKDKGLCELNTETLDAKNGEGTPNAEFNHLYIINRQPRSQGFSLFVIGKAGKGPGTGRSSMYSDWSMTNTLLCK